MIQHSKPNIKKADLVGVLECLVSDNIADGETVKEFEKLFASYFGLRANHALAFASGMDALFIGLQAMGIGPGDEVILPSYVCSAPWHAVKNCGAEPVLCDIGNDYNISAESAKQKITEKSKAIIVPHLFGQPADLEALQALGIPLIEDCAQALGAHYKEKKVGSFGKFSFFSFHASKMVTTGFGGMFLSRDIKLLAVVRSMRSYIGKDDLSLSYNSNISDFQAAMGINQFKRLEHFIDLRCKIAEIYTKKFLQTHLSIPQVFEGRKNIFYSYPIRVKRSLKQAIEFLKKNNVEAVMPIEKPLHKHLELDSASFPETEKAYLKTLSIPIYPAMSSKEVEYVSKVVARIT